jgi:hypothetical protein
MAATTVSAAAHEVLLSGRPDQMRTTTTATTSSAATSICTVASGPDRSAIACAAKPPNCAANPSSHKGWRASRSSSRGRPADDCGAAAACRCSTAAPVP